MRRITKIVYISELPLRDLRLKKNNNDHFENPPVGITSRILGSGIKNYRQAPNSHFHTVELFMHPI